jgi:hypothetical protein
VLADYTNAPQNLSNERDKTRTCDLYRVKVALYQLSYALARTFQTPAVGLEPTTLRLTAECSAIELRRNEFGKINHRARFCNRPRGGKLPDRDSNPNSLIQSQECCHYTIRQKAAPTIDARRRPPAASARRAKIRPRKPGRSARGARGPEINRARAADSKTTSEAFKLRPVRIAFLVGVAATAAGLLSLAAAYLLRPQGGGAEGMTQVILSLAGLSLGAAGGLLLVCTGPVLLAVWLTRPRASKTRG